MSRTALLAGATGLVGSHVLQLLLADDTWTHVVTVGRRSVPHPHERLEQRILDLGALEAVNLPHADDVFCCLGTTIKQAGSQAAFLINTLSYIGLITVLIAWKRPKEERPLPPESIPGAMIAGLRYVHLSPAIRNVLVRAVLFGISASCVLACTAPVQAFTRACRSVP